MPISGQGAAAGTAYEYHFAGFWSRTIAFVIDIVLVALISTLLSFIDMKVVLPEFWLFSEPWYVIALLYFAGMEASGVKGTLGKWFRGIYVAEPDGNALTFPKAIGRNLIKTIGFLVVGLGVLRVAWHSQKQGWHDELVGSFVLINR